MPLNEVTEAYRKRLKCEIADKQASVIAISMADQVPLRAENVINGIIDAYNIDAIEDKQAISNLTEEFINERLISLGEELNLADSDIATFKQTNKLYNIEREAALGAEEIKQLQQDALTLEANREMAQYILSYLKDSGESMILIPAATVTMSGASTALATQIEQYNKNVLMYERLKSTSSASNPIIIDLENQIANIRNVIEASLSRTSAVLTSRSSRSTANRTLPTHTCIARQRKRRSYYQRLVSKRLKRSCTSTFLRSSRRTPSRVLRQRVTLASSTAPMVATVPSVPRNR